MFRPGSYKSAFTSVKKYFFTSCDDDSHGVDAPEEPDWLAKADAAAEAERLKIKTPIQYEDLRGVLQGCSVNNYDGFRFIVQKQINLNTAVSHFYWLGSAAMQGNPLYQYRVVLPLDDDKTVNVATDGDFNVEGEFKFGVAPNLGLKSNFVNNQQQQMLSVEGNYNDNSSTAQIKYTKSGGDEVSLSFMQMFFPSVSIGGSVAYNVNSGAVSKSYGIHIDPKEWTLAAQYDGAYKIMYLKKVNPNRVHVGTELTVDDKGQASMGIFAEYTLKQAKLQMGLNSDATLSTQLDTSIQPGTQLQLCAEMNQAQNHYRFGFGIVLG